MSRHALSDDFELRGLWWLHGTPERAVPGIVSFNSEGIELELFGLLREPRGSSRAEPTTILGAEVMAA